MSETYRLLGFAVIALLYVVIGVMAAKGTIGVFGRLLTPRAEQTFYGVFLIVVALIYLAFVGYFGAVTAWHMEAAAVAGFVLMGLVGMRLPSALMIGFCMHGLWDSLHELQAHGGHSLFEPSRLTAIPLAYGFFCAAFDFYLAVHFYGRRDAWNAARKTGQ